MKTDKEIIEKTLAFLVTDFNFEFEYRTTNGNEEFYSYKNRYGSINMEACLYMKKYNLTEEEKAIKKKLLLDKQMARFYRKKIESYVSELLRDKSLIMASDIPINNRKDFENLIYIRLFAIESLVYRVEKTEQRVKTDKCEFTDFEIIRKQTGDKNV